jgi:hypothetical protein
MNEHGDASVEALMDLGLCTRIADPIGTWRNLNHSPEELDGVVVANRAGVLEAKEPIEVGFRANGDV